MCGTPPSHLSARLTGTDLVSIRRGIMIFVVISHDLWTRFESLSGDPTRGNTNDAARRCGGVWGVGLGWGVWVGWCEVWRLACGSGWGVWVGWCEVWGGVWGVRFDLI